MEKTLKTRTLTMRLPADLLSRLIRESDRKAIGLSEAGRLALEHWLEAQKVARRR